MPNLTDVSLIIKTFERREVLERLLASIAEQGYSGCPVLIADDSEDPYKDAILSTFGDLVDEYIVLPFDTGLSKGRNELLKHVETPYFVLNDDDFVYDERTDLGWMREQLSTRELDVLGGVVYEPVQFSLPSLRRPRMMLQYISKQLQLLYETMRSGLQEEKQNFFGDIREEGDTLVLGNKEYSGPLTRCDYCLNFFMADTDAVRERVGGWYAPLKVMEHWEFFYRAKKAGLRIATTEAVGVGHRPVQSKRYSESRLNREQRFRRIGLERHGFRRLVFGDHFVAADLDQAESALQAEG